MTELVQKIVQAYSERDLDKCKASLLFFVLACNSNVWFAEEESAENYIQKVVEQINAYRGENWLWKWPDEGSGER